MPKASPSIYGGDTASLSSSSAASGLRPDNPIDLAKIQPPTPELQPERELFSRPFLKSPSQVKADAEFKLGLCYLNGTGVPQDPVKAFESFGKAALLGESWLGLSEHFRAFC
ncbi:hypothetical protein OA90_23320 [Labrenzia sp. OB1]|nr:hypothetical protein OA90_23320 [Labrenzia sp. OB1]